MVETNSQKSGTAPKKINKRKIVGLVFGSLVVWGVGLSIFFFSKGCTEDAPAIVNLVLEESGKKYVFSNLGTEAVQASLRRNESPSSMHFLELYVDDKLYMPPQEVKDLVNLIAGNCKIHEYREKSCDGYVTNGNEEIFNFVVKNEMTENIGEQIVKSKVVIKRPESRGSLTISWHYPFGKLRISFFLD